MKFLMFLIFFLLVGAFFIISNENLRINDSEHLDIFLKEYNEWFRSLADNTSNLLGFVVKMEWLPEEEI